MQRGKVFRNNIFAGLLTKFDENSYSFVYVEEYLNKENAKPKYTDFSCPNFGTITLIKPPCTIAIDKPIKAKEAPTILVDHSNFKMV